MRILFFPSLAYNEFIHPECKFGKGVLMRSLVREETLVPNNRHI